MYYNTDQELLAIAAYVTSTCLVFTHHVAALFCVK